MIRFAKDAWKSLETPRLRTARSAGAEAALSQALPEPARRFLNHAVPQGAQLPGAVTLEMTGEIRIGKWRPFNAVQILRPGRGFVWAPTVGRMPLGFVGADVLSADDARMEFRLAGLVPVVRSSGSDVRLSARGRLAAETVAWAPWALFPAGEIMNGGGTNEAAEWCTPVDGEPGANRVVVSVPADGHSVDIELTVDPEGRPTEMSLQRWRDSADPAGWAPFGSTCESEFVLANGVRICGSGTVGWEWGTPEQSEGEFFRYRITAAEVMP